MAKDDDGDGFEVSSKFHVPTNRADVYRAVQEKLEYALTRNQS